LVVFTLLHGVLFGLRACGRLLLGSRPTLGTLLGESLAGLFEALGPTFLKVGQVLSSRPDLVTPAVAGALARLQDQVAPFDARKVPAILEEAFGRPMEEIFAHFDFSPVSSASVAQVHLAYLKDGRKVAVKIRRPGAVRQVEEDLQVLRLFARGLLLFPSLKTAPLAEIVEEVGGPIQSQLDLRLEAENNRRFRRNFAGREHIRFPHLVEGFCTEAVLTMEFLDGLQKVTATNLGPADCHVAALAGLRALYKMIFIDGFVHADMHPGNVFLRSWGEFVILDTGLVAHLSDADLKDFTDFFFGLVNNKGEECARILYEIALRRTESCDRDAFQAAIVALVAEHSSLTSRDFEVTRFVYRMIEIQRRHGICGSPRFMMTVLSMVVFDGICKRLYPECDFQAEGRGFLITAKYRRNRPDHTTREPPSVAHRPDRVGEEGPHRPPPRVSRLPVQARR
jgi:ubiquinone biosynthesis protein